MCLKYALKIIFCSFQYLSSKQLVSDETAHQKFTHAFLKKQLFFIDVGIDAFKTFKLLTLFFAN